MTALEGDVIRNIEEIISEGKGTKYRGRKHSWSCV